MLLDLPCRARQRHRIADAEPRHSRLEHRPERPFADDLERPAPNACVRARPCIDQGLMILYGAQTADGEDFPVLHRARGWRFDAYGVGNDHDVRSRPSLTRERSNVPAGNDQRMRLTVKQWPQVLTGGIEVRARKGLG